MRKLNQDLGWYWPSSLCIHLTEEQILPGELLNSSAVLFHEYIHFLQDVSTWVGCFNFVHHCNSLKLLQRYCKDVADHEVILPVSGITLGETSDRLEGQVGQAMQQERYEAIRFHVLGDGEWPDANAAVTGVDTTLRELPGHLQEGFPEVRLTLIGHDQRYCFGGMAIMESMAAACESYVFRESLDYTTRFPYNAAYQVARLVGATSLASDRIMLVAACEMALLSDAPGLAFLELLELSKSPEIHDTVQLVASATAQGVFQDTSGLDVVFAEAQVAVRDVLAPLSPECRAREWATTLLANGSQARRECPIYITAVLEKYGADSFYRFQCEVGAPVIRDAGHRLLISAPSGYDLFPIVGLEAFAHSVLLGGENTGTCSLEAYCSRDDRRSAFGYDTERCSQPWTRANDASLCPMAGWYRIFGLHEKKVVVDNT